MASQTPCGTHDLPAAVGPGKERRKPVYMYGHDSGSGTLSGPWQPDLVLRNGSCLIYSIWDDPSSKECSSCKLPYLRCICLCSTGRWLPNIRTEFRKEKVTENDPLLERGVPQAHWSLLPGWLWVYHEALQVTWVRAGPEDTGKGGRNKRRTHRGLTIKLGWDCELPGGESLRS